jgi:hypothetical protein
MFKWWLALELYLAAVVADVAGHSNLAIAVALAATVAVVVALELDVDPSDDDVPRMTVERLALVLVYAWQHSNVLGDTDPAYFHYVASCRRRAIGIG